MCVGSNWNVGGITTPLYIYHRKYRASVELVALSEVKVSRDSEREWGRRATHGPLEVLAELSQYCGLE